MFQNKYSLAINKITNWYFKLLYKSKKKGMHGIPFLTLK